MISAVAPPSLRQKFEKSSRYALYSVFLSISMFISSKSSAGTHSKPWKGPAMHCCLGCNCSRKCLNTLMILAGPLQSPYCCH